MGIEQRLHQGAAQRAARMFRERDRRDALELDCQPVHRQRGDSGDERFAGGQHAVPDDYFAIHADAPPRHPSGGRGIIAGSQRACTD